MKIHNFVGARSQFKVNQPQKKDNNFMAMITKIKIREVLAVKIGGSV